MNILNQNRESIYPTKCIFLISFIRTEFIHEFLNLVTEKVIEWKRKWYVMKELEKEREREKKLKKVKKTPVYMKEMFGDILLN